MSQKGAVHFIAIGGIGMSALAKILKEMGYDVSGSDVKSSKVIEDLRQIGVIVHIGHDAGNVPANCSEIIYSSAIAEDNPELLKARELGIPITHRGALLARLFNAGQGLAVAGAHGKTTTSAMLAQIYYGEHLEPNIVLGGILPAIDSNALKGESDVWVVEADESDGSFLELTPSLAIITNIEPEHMVHYHTEEKLREAFRQFVAQSDDCILCLDNLRTREMAEQLDGKFHSYGLEHSAVDLTAKNIRLAGLASDSDIYFRGNKVAELHLGVPGVHNVSNALAAMYAAFLGGVPFANSAKQLSSFTGTKRRFEVLYSDDNITIVDDYAHHPTEVKATIRAAKDGGFQRVIAVFQPHRYSRVQELYKEFGSSFGDADVIIIDEIYSAWEEKIEGVTSQMIVAEIEKQGLKPLHFDGKDGIINYLLKHMTKGDIALLMGAGDIRQTSEKLRDILMGD